MTLRASIAVALPAVLLVGLSGWSQQASPKKPAKLPPAPPGVVIEENVAYLAPGRPETADIYLAAMLAVADSKDGLDPTGPYAEFSCRVQCAVPMYGAYDFTERDDLVILGKKRADAPDAYRSVSPIVYLNAKTPPMLLLCGTAD